MKQLFDFTLAFVTAVRSGVNKRTGATTITASGIGGFAKNATGISGTTTGDLNGELGEEQEMYGALGVLARPLDPETLGGKAFAAEAIAARTSDGLVPLSWRDFRLDRFFPNGLPKGSIRTVGYGGGFSSLDVKAGTSGATRTNTHTVYIPYEWANGVATKCHSLIIDPDPANGITINHGSGYQLALTSDGFLMRTSDDKTFFSLKEGIATLSATKVFLRGTVYAGLTPEVGLPALPSVAFPGCPSLFLSPV